MMFELLKFVAVLPLRPLAVSGFLYHVADLAVIGAITTDDWCYLARLVNYRIKKQSKGEVK